MNSLFSFSFESAASNTGGPVFMATEFEIVVSQDELDFIQIGSGYSQVNCFFFYTRCPRYIRSKPLPTDWSMGRPIILTEIVYNEQEALKSLNRSTVFQRRRFFNVSKLDEQIV